MFFIVDHIDINIRFIFCSYMLLSNSFAAKQGSDKSIDQGSKKDSDDNSNTNTHGHGTSTNVVTLNTKSGSLRNGSISVGISGPGKSELEQRRLSGSIMNTAGHGHGHQRKPSGGTVPLVSLGTNTPVRKLSTTNNETPNDKLTYEQQNTLILQLQSMLQKFTNESTSSPMLITPEPVENTEQIPIETDSLTAVPTSPKHIEIHI
jgi:hypothetical protein